MDHAAAASATGWFALLEQSALGQAMRSSPWLFPAVEVVHILGFALLVGAIAAFDLRLLGFRLMLPADQLARLLLPVAVAGFALAVPAGVLLFTSEAVAFARNPMLWAKLGLIALALINIAVFHIGPGRRWLTWADARPPTAVRVAGAVSLAAWTGAIVCGRLIAYV